MTHLRSLLCALALAACAPGGAVPGDAAASAASPDSLRGVVMLAGSDPGGTVALVLDGGAHAVELRGPRPALDRLQALEVTVWGASEGRAFRVERLAVRAAEGVPAADGILVREGERYLLATADGRRLALEHVPSDLSGRVGAWVWISGVPGRFPDTFGVIREAP